jgi:hypothetical protein
MTERTPPREFGKRRPAAVEPAEPVKRSGHVALLLMGTLAVGGGAYALMRADRARRGRAGIATIGREMQFERIVRWRRPRRVFASWLLRRYIRRLAIRGLLRFRLRRRDTRRLRFAGACVRSVRRRLKTLRTMP